MGKGLGNTALWSLAYIQSCGSCIKIVINETAKQYLKFKTKNDTNWVMYGSIHFSKPYPNYMISSQ